MVMGPIYETSTSTRKSHQSPIRETSTNFVPTKVQSPIYETTSIPLRSKQSAIYETSTQVRGSVQSPIRETLDESLPAASLKRRIINII